MIGGSPHGDLSCHAATWSATPAELLHDRELRMLELCRYGRLGPEYVESLPVNRVRYLREVLSELFKGEKAQASSPVSVTAMEDRE